jgi:hypothetical protein
MDLSPHLAAQGDNRHTVFTAAKARDQWTTRALYALSLHTFENYALTVSLYDSVRVLCAASLANQ